MPVGQRVGCQRLIASTPARLSLGVRFRAATNQFPAGSRRELASVRKDRCRPGSAERTRSGWSNLASRGSAARGSRPCAARVAEPRQARKGATVRRSSRVPQAPGAHVGPALPTSRALVSYTVLALKHRPTSFDEVVGQTTVIRTLRNALERGTIGHAFLLSGARGVGKTTTARILAKALNCAKAVGPTANPCSTRSGEDKAGACSSCREIAAGKSLDVQEIDGASNNSVDQVRELRESAALQPGARPLQDLDHRRGPHALDGGVQRTAEDARGAAAARQVHLRHDRVPQDPGDDPLALPAVRLPLDPGPRARPRICATWRTRRGSASRTLRSP